MLDNWNGYLITRKGHVDGEALIDIVFDTIVAPMAVLSTAGLMVVGAEVGLPLVAAVPLAILLGPIAGLLATSALSFAVIAIVGVAYIWWLPFKIFLDD